MNWGIVIDLKIFEIGQDRKSEANLIFTYISQLESLKDKIKEGNFRFCVENKKVMFACV